jgi:ribose transport system substrate-binding protein
MFLSKRTAGLILTQTIAFTALAAGTAQAVADDKIVIGFSQATMNSPFRVVQTQKMVDAAKAHPDVELIVTDGQGDSAKQVSDMESLIARGVKVLTVSANSAAALTPSVRRAMRAGIPVVTIDRKVNTAVTAHVGGVNEPIGEAAGKLLIEKLGNKGAVAEIQGVAGASVTIDRHEGFLKALKGSGLKEVAVQYGDFQREPALKFTEDLLQRFKEGELQAIFAQNDEMALGVIQALETAGRKDILVVSIDGQERAFEAIKAGKMLATFVYPMASPEGLEIAYKLAKNEKVPAETTLDFHRVDASNVGEWLGKGF